MVVLLCICSWHEQKKTPVMYATYPGHLDVVKYLIEKGADIHKADNEVGNAKAR